MKKATTKIDWIGISLGLIGLVIAFMFLIGLYTQQVIVGSLNLYIIIITTPILSIAGWVGIWRENKRLSNMVTVFIIIFCLIESFVLGIWL